MASSTPVFPMRTASAELKQPLTGGEEKSSIRKQESFVTTTGVKKERSESVSQGYDSKQRDLRRKKIPTKAADSVLPKVRAVCVHVTATSLHCHTCPASRTPHSSRSSGASSLFSLSSPLRPTEPLASQRAAHQHVRLP